MSSSRMLVVAAGVAVAGLIAPMSAVAASDSVTTRPAPSGPRYTAEIVGERGSPNPEYPTSLYGSTAQGITAAGAVLADGSLGQPRRMRAVDLTGADGSRVRPTQVSDDGTVYGADWQNVYRLQGKKVDRRTVKPSDGYGLSLGAANDRGLVAGCVGFVKVGVPFMGDFQRNALKRLGWPDGTSGNCSVTGLSRGGVATVNQEPPNYRTEDVYPRAATMTTKGVQFLRAPAGAASWAGAISPDGRRIAGTVTKDGVTTTSWLSHGRAPQALRGARGITPVEVTDQGVVFGRKGDRIVRWENGRVTDLTQASGLPRGWVVTDVAGLNARGQLAVTVEVSGTPERVAMRLTPRGGR